MSATSTAIAERKHDQADAILYAEVFGLLISLTILTVTLSYVNVGWIFDWTGRAANIVAGLLVAVAKGGLVLWFFMHMNHESRWNRSIFLFALCLFSLVVVAFSFEFVWLGTYVVKTSRAAMGM